MHIHTYAHTLLYVCVSIYIYIYIYISCTFSNNLIIRFTHTYIHDYLICSTCCRASNNLAILIHIDTQIYNHTTTCSTCCTASKRDKRKCPSQTQTPPSSWRYACMHACIYVCMYVQVYMCACWVPKDFARKNTCMNMWVHMCACEENSARWSAKYAHYPHIRMSY